MATRGIRGATTVERNDRDAILAATRELLEVMVRLNGVRPEDIGFGQGVKVTRVASARPDELSVVIDVATSAPVGMRDVSVAGTVRPAVFSITSLLFQVRRIRRAADRTIRRSGSNRPGDGRQPRPIPVSRHRCELEGR